MNDEVISIIIFLVLSIFIFFFFSPTKQMTKSQSNGNNLVENFVSDRRGRGLSKCSSQCRSPHYDTSPLPKNDDCKVNCKDEKNNVCSKFPVPNVVYNGTGLNQALYEFIQKGNKKPLGLILGGPQSTAITSTSQSIGFNDPQWISPNQKLVGGPNPKTLIAPVIVPPISSLDYWKNNNLAVKSGINTATPFDVINSGYKIQPCPKKPLPLPENKCYMLPNTIPRNPRCGRQNLQPTLEAPMPCGSCGVTPPQCFCGHYSPQNPSSARCAVDTIENFRYKSKENTGPVVLDDVTMDMSCGYDQPQLSTGLPTNYPSSKCGKKNEFTSLNDNIFTATVTPGVYQNSQIIEPINSNIGISLVEQTPPTTLTECDGNLLFEQHDPNLFIEPNQKCTKITPNAANVTDPRYTGYGTSYRSYNDPMTGAPRFYYKDVDAIRMPNYITRSKIDVNSWADTYGPIPDGDAKGNKYNQDIRTLANNAFLDATIQQRTELMQRCMRKRNANAWQRKLYPISTSSQRI